MFVFGAPIIFFVVVISSPAGDFFLRAGADLMDRHYQRAALAPIIEKAKLWAVDYDTARAGDYVLWCVDHPAKGVAYLAGRPLQPLVLSNEAELETNSPSSGGRCTEIVGQVEGRKPQGLVVRYIGLP